MVYGIKNYEKEVNKNILSVIDYAFKKFGKTKNVFRKYYIHLIIIKSYKDKPIEPYFKMTQSIASTLLYRQ